MTTRANDDVFPASEGQFVGLSKREHFAALAMKGILSHYGIDSVVIDPEHPAKVGAAACRYADGLIAALNQQEPTS